MNAFLWFKNINGLYAHKFRIWRKDARPFPVLEIKAEETRGKRDYGRVF